MNDEDDTTDAAFDALMDHLATMFTEDDATVDSGSVTIDDGVVTLADRLAAVFAALRKGDGAPSEDDASDVIAALIARMDKR